MAFVFKLYYLIFKYLEMISSKYSKYCIFSYNDYSKDVNEMFYILELQLLKNTSSGMVVCTLIALPLNV